MVVEVITNTELSRIEEEEARPYPPNRKDFERSLGQLNHDINTQKAEINKLHDQDAAKDADGGYGEFRQKMVNNRVEKEKLRKFVIESRDELKEIKKDIDAKTRQQLEIDKDCRVKTMELVDHYLTELRERYSKVTAIREEQHLVKEIDAFVRNKAKLVKLHDVLKEKGELQKKYSALKDQNTESYRKLQGLRKEKNELGEQLNAKHRQMQYLKHGLHELFEERSRLITDYNHNRNEYGEWMRNNKKKILASASFPKPNRRRNNSVCVDEEELEPFYEQKRDLKRIINYLEKLASHVKPDTSVDKVANSTENDDSDSADEFTPGILKMRGSQTQMSPAKQESLTKQRNHCKIGKGTKMITPLSHDVTIYGLFGAVEVPDPKTYQEVHNSLAVARQKLNMFEQATFITNWSEELKALGDLNLNAGVMSRSVSEFTGDSTFPDSASEVASIVSSRSRHHPDSPIARPESPAPEILFIEPKDPPTLTRISPSMPAEDEGIDSASCSH